MAEGLIWHDARTEFPQDSVMVRMMYRNDAGMLVLSRGVYLADKSMIVDTEYNKACDACQLLEWAYESAFPGRNWEYSWDGTAKMYT